MLRAEHLTKTYTLGDHTFTALDDATFRIAPGEYTAIVGPSGSGKSTLMHLLGCLDAPTSGRYCLHGRDVSTLSDDDLAQVRGEEIGFVFQGFQLIPRLSAIENVALPMVLCGIPAKKRLERAEQLLCRVGLGSRMHHRPAQLSGGQQQRVAIARALSRDPAVLLADEPTGSLDPAATDEVLALLEALHREGRTVLLITHDMKVAAQAGRQLHIADGRLVHDTGKM